MTGNAQTIDAAIAGFDADLIAVRDRILSKASGMIAGVDREITRLQILEDCVATLKSANDNAVALLQAALAESGGQLWAERMAAELDRELGGMRHQ